MKLSNKKEIKIKLEKNTWRRVISAKNILTNNKQINEPPLTTPKIQKNNETKRNRPVSSLYSKNVNTYLFLYSPDNKETNKFNDWVLNLRGNDTNLNYHISKTSLGEPSFYQQDIKNFLKKTKNEKKLKKLESLITRNNFPVLSQYSYLFKKTNDASPLTKDLLDFELSLRIPNKKVKILHKWNSSNNIKKNNYTSNDYQINFQKGVKEKFIMRPYSVTMRKIKYRGDNIIQKKCEKDFTKVCDMLGEHYSKGRYNDKYDEKNFYIVENLVSSIEKTQNNIWYKLGLRNLKNKKDKKGYSIKGKTH